MNQKKGLWVIFVYCIFQFVNDKVLDFIFQHNYDGQKYFLSSYTLIEFIFLSLYLRRIIDNRLLKKIILFTSITFCVFLIFYFFIAKWDFFDSIPVGAESIVIIIFSVYYLFEQINKPKTLFIYNSPSFWIVFGFLIYLSGSFFIYLYANFVPLEEIHKFWFVTFILNTIKNILFSIGMIVSKYDTGENPYSKKNLHVLN